MATGQAELTALKRQLAEMAVTLGQLTDPAEDGSGPTASAGEVTLFDFWDARLNGLKSAKVNAQYFNAICHLQNRLRKCDTCGVVLCPLRRPAGRSKPRLMRDRKCVICSRSTSCTPTAKELTGSLLTAWVSQIISDGYSAETSMRFLKQIRAVLNAMLDTGEPVRPPRRMVGLTRGASNIVLVPADEIRATYQACEVAKVWSPVFWRTLICGLTLYGFRVGELTSLMWRGDRIGNVREGISFGQKAPSIQLQIAKITSQHGWLVYLPSKQAAKKPDCLVLPLSKVWRTHLLAARSLRNKTGQVLPISASEKGNYELREPEFRDEFKRIQNAAGVRSGWTFKALRSTFETFYGAQFSTEDARAMSGHADRTVSGVSYNEKVIRWIGQVDQFELNQIFEA
jgi:hypothetical protein